MYKSTDIKIYMIKLKPIAYNCNNSTVRMFIYGYIC